MAIEEQTAAEQRCGLFDETAQRLMIGAVQPFNSPLRLRTGLAHTADPTGRAHSGTNPAARADALKRVPQWLAR